MVADPISVLTLFSQVIRCQSGMFGNAGEHTRTYLFPIMKSKGNVAPPRSFNNPMGTFLLFDAPANPCERNENARRLNGAPLHSQTNEKLARSHALAQLCRRAFSRRRHKLFAVPPVSYCHKPKLPEASGPRQSSDRLLPGQIPPQAEVIFYFYVSSVSPYNTNYTQFAMFYNV